MYSIEKIKLSEDNITQMVSIGRACFGATYDGRQLSRNWKNCSPDTVFFGVREGEKLRAFNGFLSHSASLGKKPIRLFQSCHSATDPACRGKGLFTRIIRHAIETLPGTYMVGYPNVNSAPIFESKLGFHVVPMTRVIIPLALPGSSVLRMGEHRDEKDVIELDYDALYKWKSSEHPGELVEIRCSDSDAIWGRVTLRSRLALNVRVFEVGHTRFSSAAVLAQLLRLLRMETGADFARFVCPLGGRLSRMSRFSFSAKKTEPLIWHPLGEAAESPVFEAYPGLKDVF